MTPDLTQVPVLILAGGLGTRISEETHLKPKPMIEIGGKPILWHIMKIYSAHGFNEFILCLGYKGYFIKEFFSNYFLHMSDVTFDMRTQQMEVHRRTAEPWRVTLVDTGGRGVERITPRGIVANGVEYPLDVLIYATGFQWMGAGSFNMIVGREGKTLRDKWKEGGVKTFLGLERMSLN